ncbi:MAG: type II toxin-antitoxin system VapC family toxin [Thermoanaerobaculia bacterium]
MILPDVNVLVYAFSAGAVDHERYRSWLEGVLDSPEAWAYSELVLSGFVRVVTHPRVFDPAAPMDAALRFCAILRGRPNAIAVSPGERHWEIFEGLCRSSGARGNLVADAYLAALAIESGSEWITTDRDFARFSLLRWRHPLG